MIRITTSSFSQNSEVIELSDSVQINVRLSIGYELICAIAGIELFLWGSEYFISKSYFLGIFGGIMLVFFIVASYITAKKKITINPETGMVQIVTWSDYKTIEWTSEMKLNYERKFNDSDELIGIRLHLIDIDGNENDLVLFSTENEFRNFVDVYNQKFNSFKLEVPLA